MLKAIIFFKIDLKAMNKVIEKLKEIPQIKKLLSLTGDYDAIAEIETETSEELFDIFCTQIDMIDGLTDTNTHVVMKSWEK
ncbi:MAG: Lrp/AsnC ligand binding domain-containing protein [Candidatus Lokiarchaeota archaeon]|nr:Lrp/AsnC ligand binding domain-containing protein [Candidatus Lokiarchaeota archaeon]